MKKIFIVIAFLSTLFITTHAQVKQSYRQFFFNPYLYNSAFAGVSGRSELNVMYKKQWINFNDAPVSTNVNLQLPTSDKVVLAFNLNSNTEFLWRNTSFVGTFGYVVPIDSKQSLRFGLSGGVGLKKLDLTSEELSTSDQAILNAASSNFYVDGNFGFAYTNSGLRLGVAFTQLFKSNPFENDFNQFALSNLKNRVYSASYRFNIDAFEKFSLEPYVVYHQTADGFQNAWEAASILYFQDKLWTGAGYHEQRGLSLFFGMNVMEKFRFSYSYEFPPFTIDSPSFSSHELQLTFRFGKRGRNMAESSPGMEAADAISSIGN